MRKDGGANWIARVEHEADAVRIARLQRDDLQHIRVGAAQIRSCRLLRHPPLYRVPRSSRFRVVSSVNVSDSRGMLVTNGPTIQPNPVGIPRDSDTDSQ